MGVDFIVATLGDKYQDYRQDILGDSYTWGPVINANNVQYFALHHSVTAQTAKNDGNWKAECDVIAQEHVNQGWGGIGYRWVICSDGTVAYVGDLSHGGSAVAGNNDIIFSACMVGDFTKELPTAAQIHSAHLLADWIFTNAPQYPKLSGWDQLIGHQDAAGLLHLPGATPTACPGPAWRDPNDSLRSRVINDSYKGYPDPQPVVASPTVPVQPPVNPTPAPAQVVQSDPSQGTSLAASLSIITAKSKNFDPIASFFKLSNDQIVAPGTGQSIVDNIQQLQAESENDAKAVHDLKNTITAYRLRFGNLPENSDSSPDGGDTSPIVAGDTSVPTTPPAPTTTGATFQNGTNPVSGSTPPPATKPFNVELSPDQQSKIAKAWSGFTALLRTLLW